MQNLEGANDLWQHGPSWQPHGVPTTRSKAPTALNVNKDLRTRQSDWTAQENYARHPNQKRRACNQCKQQKLRCDLAGDENPAVISCSRCTKLGLECRIDEGFQRERKRKRAVELESEVLGLKHQLAVYRNVASSNLPSATGEISPLGSPELVRGVFDSTPHPDEVFSGSSNDVPGLAASLTTPSHTTSGSTDAATLSAIITRPHEHEIVPPRTPSTASPIAVPRKLAETELTTAEIDQLFAKYVEPAIRVRMRLT